MQIQQYFNTSITVLTNQVSKLLIALFKVPNTGAFTVLAIIRTELSARPGGEQFLWFLKNDLLRFHLILFSFFFTKANKYFFLDVLGKEYYS